MMMETTILNFRSNSYITSVQKLEFHIPYVQILDISRCFDSRQTAFKRHKSFQDVLCLRDYAERVFSSFAHQIQSEYYSGNRSVSIEGVEL